MDTLKWIVRLFFWPFIVLLDTLQGDVSEWYLVSALGTVCLGLILFVLACVAAFVPLWPFPSVLANAIVLYMSISLYLIVGLMFYFKNPQSVPRIGRWQHNGPW